MGETKAQREARLAAEQEQAEQEATSDGQPDQEPEAAAEEPAEQKADAAPADQAPVFAPGVAPGTVPDPAAPDGDAPVEWVTMKHKDIEVDSGPVTKQAFDEVWKPLGWEVASTVATSDDGRPVGVEES